MARASNRPLSPHLQIWRWGPGMISSILHRVSGVGASLGLVLLLWWLGSLVSGEGSYARFTDLFWGDISGAAWAANAGEALLRLVFRIVLVGVSWAFFAHAVTGIRHFVLDTGAGYELDQNNLWATISTVAGFILTAVFWAAILLR